MTLWQVERQWESDSIPLGWGGMGAAGVRAPRAEWPWSWCGLIKSGAHDLVFERLESDFFAPCKCGGNMFGDDIIPSAGRSLRWAGPEAGEYPVSCREGWALCPLQRRGTWRSDQPSPYHVVTGAAANSFTVFSFLKKFYWNIVDSQCGVNFYHTTKWLSYIYIFFPYSFTLWFIIRYWI